MLKKVKKIPLKVIRNKSGDIIKYIDKKSLFFKKFGEVYFNEIKRSKKENDWIFHKKYQCIILVIQGKIQFNIKNKKKIKKLNLSNKRILVISPCTWFKFSSITKSALFVNLIDGSHDPKETIREKI